MDNNKPPQDFSSAKKGDKVYSTEYGYGQISDVHKDRLYCIEVLFEEEQANKPSYTLNGKFRKESVSSSLFWDKPEIIAPCKPIEVVTKEVYGYLNIYPTSPVGYRNFYTRIENANNNSTEDCLGTVSAILSYRVPEDWEDY